MQANQKLIAKLNKAESRPNSNENVKTLISKVETNKLGLDYKHIENEFDDFVEEVLLPHSLSQNGPFSAVEDVNGDGLDDLFIGGAANQAAVLYLQNNNGQFSKSPSQPWESDKASEDMECLFIDVDGDNDYDLYVASGGNEFKDGNHLLKIDCI